jgi:hypothetical protein
MAPKGYEWKVTVVIRVHAHRMGQDHFRVTSELLFAAVVLRDRMSLSSYHPRARNSSVWVSFPASVCPFSLPDPFSPCFPYNESFATPEHAASLHSHGNGRLIRRSPGSLSVFRNNIVLLPSLGNSGVPFVHGQQDKHSESRIGRPRPLGSRVRGEPGS